MASIIDEAIDNGFITIYANTDPEIAGQIHSYNITASRYRTKMKRLKQAWYIQLAYHFFTIIVLWIRFDPEGTRFSRPELTIPICVLNAVVLVFSLFFSNKQICAVLCIFAAASLLLIYWEIYLPLIINIGVFVASIFIRKSLENRRGYPEFNNVLVSYVQINSPY